MGQGERLRAARLQRGWTADDVAAALHRLAAELGEAEPAVERNQVSKWERGIRSPGRYYRGRLCLVFEATPAELGWAPTPRLLAEIGELSRRRLSCQRQQGLGVVHPAGPVPSARAFEGSDRERLAATLRYLWPADRPLVDGLARAGRRLSQRTDTEPPRLALPDLRAFLGALLILLSRSQQPELARRLMRLGSTAAQHAGFLSDVAGRWPDAYQDLSVSESLARESGSGSQLAMALVNKAEVYSRRAHGPQDLGAAVTLAEAAELALDDEASPGLRAWIAGERAAQEAELGQELAAGRHLERAYRVSAGASAAEMNLFSDLDSTWLEQYRGSAALSLGHADEAIEVFTAVLDGTDAGLPWERSRALSRLAWGWALRGEVEGTCELLLRAVELTRSNGDRRGLALAVQVRDRHLATWRGDPRVRDLDEAIRAAQRAQDVKPPAATGR